MRQLQRVGLVEHAHDAAGSLPLGKQRVVEIARAGSRPNPAAARRTGCGPALCRKAAARRAGIKTLKGEGMTVLLVEHDMDFVMGLVDRLVVPISGRNWRRACRGSAGRPGRA